MKEQIGVAICEILGGLMGAERLTSGFHGIEHRAARSCNIFKTVAWTVLRVHLKMPYMFSRDTHSRHTEYFYACGFGWYVLCTCSPNPNRTQPTTMKPNSRYSVRTCYITDRERHNGTHCCYATSSAAKIFCRVFAETEEGSVPYLCGMHVGVVHAALH